MVVEEVDTDGVVVGMDGVVLGGVEGLAGWAIV